MSDEPESEVPKYPWAGYPLWRRVLYWLIGPPELELPDLPPPPARGDLEEVARAISEGLAQTQDFVSRYLDSHGLDEDMEVMREILLERAARVSAAIRSELLRAWGGHCSLADLDDDAVMTAVLRSLRKTGMAFHDTTAFMDREALERFAQFLDRLAEEEGDDQGEAEE